MDITGKLVIETNNTVIDTHLKGIYFITVQGNNQHHYKLYF